MCPAADQRSQGTGGESSRAGNQYYLCKLTPSCWVWNVQPSQEIPKCSLWATSEKQSVTLLAAVSEKWLPIQIRCLWQSRPAMVASRHPSPCSQELKFAFAQIWNRHFFWVHDLEKEPFCICLDPIVSLLTLSHTSTLQGSGCWNTHASPNGTSLSSSIEGAGGTPCLFWMASVGICGTSLLPQLCKC